MKTEMAMKLIADQMKWTDEVATKEFSVLKLMIGYKYDQYYGFHSGARFYLALMGWLSQFSLKSERETAYSFLKKNLIFISQREMHHLVGQLMPIIDRTLRRETAKELQIPLFETWTTKKAKDRVELKRIRTLFIALSDGARIDVFRRYNEGLISNEQIVASSEISEEKWVDLLDNLKKPILALGLPATEVYFERVCLIDDFTGSGSSLIRFDEEKRKWKGKIKRFCEQYHGRIPVCLKQNGEKWPIQIHHHLASAKAALQISGSLATFSVENPDFEFSTTYSYKLPQDIVIDDNSNPDLVNLITTYYDKNIEDEHTKKDIWFGYRQSGLPLVLDHNTPNNSIALLWAESEEGKVPEKHKMKPLFIRRKRHSSHG